MSDQLNIAVYHSLHSGGARRTLYEQVRRLAEHHRLELYSLSSADQGFGDVHHYVEASHIYDFQPGRLFDSPFGRLNQGVRVADLLRLRHIAQRVAGDIDAQGYDVVLVHPCRYTQGPWLLHFLQTPAVYYCHERLRMVYETPPARFYATRKAWRRILDQLDLLDMLYRRLLRKVDRLATRRADIVLVNSRFTQAAVAHTYGVDAVVCYHGVDTDAFRPLGLKREGFILSVGALTPLKGFDFVIEGLGLLPAEERPPLALVSNYQEPIERRYLEELATQRGVKVRYHTMVDDQALIGLYNRASLTIYTPVREPFGLVPLESMACGTPVIGVDEGGVPETIIHGQTGLLVKRRPQELAEAIITLLKDPERSAHYGAAGRAHVLRNWGWHRAIEGLEHKLEQASNGRDPFTTANFFQ
jgi:glycosyltransferase involved in cell wall biosynthesis